MPRFDRHATIAITCADGEFLVMAYCLREVDAGGRVLMERTATTEAINAEIAKCLSNRNVVKWRIINEAEFPAPFKETYFGAWKDTGTAIVHDMARAREIHRELLRRERALLLEGLDTDYLRADEQGDNQKKREIAAEKQRLRDITKLPAIDAAATIEDLKAIKIT